jgi:hypothetical protein
MTDEEYRKLEKDATAADCLRQSYYQLKNGNIIKGFNSLLKSIHNNPSYIVDKVKHNILRMK